MPASKQGRTARRHAAVYRVSSYSTFCVRCKNYITHVKESFRAIDCITTRFSRFFYFFYFDFLFCFFLILIVGCVQARNVTIFQTSCIIVSTNKRIIRLQLQLCLGNADFTIDRSILLRNRKRLTDFGIIKDRKRAF